MPRDAVPKTPNRETPGTEHDRAAEANWSKAIGSTASGTGAALIRRMHRPGRSILVESSELVRSFAHVASVPALCHELIDRGGDLIVEGTQGFGLSLLHGDYPYVTLGLNSIVCELHYDRFAQAVRRFSCSVS